MTPIKIENVVYRFIGGSKRPGDVVLERLYVGKHPWERVHYETLAFEVCHFYQNEDVLYPYGQGGEFLKNFIKQSRVDSQKATKEFLSQYK